MEKKKQTPEWASYLRGILLALGVYLVSQMLVALLLVKGVLPERHSFLVVAVCCVVSALVGGLWGGKSSLGRLAGGMLVAAGFAVVLVAVGLLCWDGIVWTGHGGILLLCALAGGLLSGLAGGKRSRRGKRKALRR